MEIRQLELDLPALTGAFGRRLREAGLPVGPERAARFAAALSVARPLARRRLYWIARVVFVSDRTQVPAFEAVFRDVFGAQRAGSPPDGFEPEPTLASPGDGAAEMPDGAAHEGSVDEMVGRPGAMSSGGEADTSSHDAPVPVLASDEEVLRGKHFDALTPEERRELPRLMAELELATPLRRSRRSERRRHGSSVDLRRTLRRSLRTAGDPIQLARRERRPVRRRIVLLCDISGSMEPYARAYLQFLVCAAGAGPRAEAFVFATRLTRLTRALRSRNPDRAIQRAAATAPDWSSGTRIGDALKAFNDRHGRRGMARGAVVVILSDGWERGDPGLVGQELERLRRLAYRIVWVNPRAAAPGFAPRAGGMAAALPYCDALVSGHSLEAMSEVTAAIAAPRAACFEWDVAGDALVEAEEETWGSATPVPGSSVAMPSGYGPSRGRTTPGWGLGG